MVGRTRWVCRDGLALPRNYIYRGGKSFLNLPSCFSPLIFQTHDDENRVLRFVPRHDRRMIADRDPPSMHELRWNWIEQRVLLGA